jgi:hypothetical protein
MMVWATHAVSHFIGLTMWCVVHNVATSCRFIASAIPAHERSSTQCCTVERLCSLLYARITGHDDDLVMRGLTSITCKHCCMPVAVKPFFITAYGPWRAMVHVSSPEPSSVERRGLESCDKRWHESPPPRRGEVRSRETRGSTGALPSREAGSRAVGHVAALKPT